ncbi:MAG: hypothetical protein J0H43_10625 [Actinobacteria bacterium]|nr:hypothetical protein [Actinomycetota bacterium]
MQLPSPVRAAVGLLANVADEAKQLPERAIELPMLAVSTALQMSLRAQQRYARLAARGDEVLNRRPVTDEPPSWATFDEPVPVEQLRAASELLDELLAAGVVENEPVEEAPAPPVKKTPATRAAAKKAPATAVPTRKAAPRTSTSSAVKSINAPRHTAPSRFDTVDDE